MEATRTNPLHDAPAPPREEAMLHSLQTAPSSTGAPTCAARPTLPEDLEALGPYRLVAKIGAGSSGTVYVALSAESGEEVALKVLHGVVADQRQRFDREVAAHKRVSSPHIAGLLDAGEARLPDGRSVLFLAFELVRGGTLRDVLRGGEPLDPASAAMTIDALARGLACLHRHGLTHRDVKPENVLVSETGEIKLTDLGLIREVGDASLAASLDGTGRNTRSGAFVGTVAYASPEQIEGRPARPRMSGRSG